MREFGILSLLFGLLGLVFMVFVWSQGDFVFAEQISSFCFIALAAGAFFCALGVISDRLEVTNRLLADIRNAAVGDHPPVVLGGTGWVAKGRRRQWPQALPSAQTGGPDLSTAPAGPTANRS